MNQVIMTTPPEQRTQKILQPLLQIGCRTLILIDKMWNLGCKSQSELNTCLPSRHTANEEGIGREREIIAVSASGCCTWCVLPSKARSTTSTSYGLQPQLHNSMNHGAVLMPCDVSALSIEEGQHKPHCNKHQTAHLHAFLHAFLS